MKGQWIGQKGRRYCWTLNENLLFLLCFKGRLVLCECVFDITKSCFKRLWDVSCCLLCVSLKLQGQTIKREMKNQQPP